MNYGLELGSITIRYYGLILSAAILLCWWLALKHSKKKGWNPRLVENMMILGVVFGLLGARVYVVLFNWDYFSGHLTEIYQIWKGGIGIYGAIISAIFTIIVYSKKKKIDFWAALDLFALFTPLGQAIGRWGNFFNQEAFGPPTNLPWKIFISPQNRPFAYLQEKYFHPTFLYESLWDLLVLGRLLSLAQRSTTSGKLTAVYLGLYSFGRFFIEYLRLDSHFLMSWRLNQLVSAAVFLTAFVIFYHRSKTNAQNS
ncbi:MAG: prolipoprotein diacylglyceryl transferase [bacterium]|nr:prolipoprotein diacylglyceryl transferase [bacterium]